MVVNIELTEVDLKQLIRDKIEEIANVEVALDDIKIEVKSSQNYKSEWETAKFRAVYQRHGTK